MQSLNKESKSTKRPKPSELPFYALPHTSKTSAEIISEARAAIRAVHTKRPFTPRDDDRRLFGNNVKLNCRPPSSFSLDKSRYESGDSRPVSAVRLEPLEKNPKVKATSHTVVNSSDQPSRPSTSCGRLPSIPNERGFCLDNYYSILLPEGITAETLRRRRHSQPVTTKVSRDFALGERTVGDGGEVEIQRRTSLKVCPIRLNHKGKLEEKDLITNSSREVDNCSEKYDYEDYYRKKIRPLLDEYFPLQTLADGDHHFCDVTKQLYEALETENLLGKNFTHRSSILKILYKLLDSKDQRLQLSLARVILAMKVKGNNLSALCKLIFKITRTETNDQLFLDDNLLDVFLQSIDVMHPIQDSEALVYGVGALKFLSMNETLLKELSNLGCIDVITKLIGTINEQKVELNIIPEQISHVLFQLTGCLRNLAEGVANRHSFLSSGIVPQLIRCLDLFKDEVDIIMNISRILSKLTTHSDICAIVTTEKSCFSSVIFLLQKYHRRQEVTVRLAFILGNLTAKNKDARMLLFALPETVDTILGLLHMYLTHNLKLAIQDSTELSTSSAPSEDGSTELICTEVESEDVVIKLIRVIANMSIHPHVGPIVAANDDCLQTILTILSEKTHPQNQELILSTLATLNNLSYYSVEKGAIATKLLEITGYLVTILLRENMGELVEVTRVLGNLTRSVEVRDFLVKRKVLHMMVATLDSRNKELVYTSCGVLINFMADEDKRNILQSEGGVKKLIDVLRDFGCSDWQLASMVCQALWNYTTKMTSVADTIGEQEVTELVNILEELLNENTAMEVCCQHKLNDLQQESVHDEWALVFSPVAENLLKRIEKVIK